jgi:signal transduction histidine kinase
MNRIAPAAIAKKMTVHDAVAKIIVKSDETALVQIMTILLDNAVKYSPTKSEIFIDAKARNKTAQLTVRDQGIGVKATDLPHIFDRFYRADTSRSKHTTEGYGLGLSIARKLTDQLGIEISAKSQPDKGTTFTLKIPMV